MEIIKTLFGVEVIKATPFKRSDEGAVLNLFLIGKDGKEYFLKEVQQHSMREGLDELYVNLSKVKSDRFDMILPIAHKTNSTKFFFEQDKKTFLLFNKEIYKPFDKNQYLLNQLIDDLLVFQGLIEEKSFSKQSYRTYESWVNIGLERFAHKFGETPAFIEKFEKFMSERFPKIEFTKGNIHWDIHEDNLGLRDDGKLVLLDFDLVQEGCKIQDLLAAVGIYIDWSKARNQSPEMFFQEVLERVSPYAKNMQLNDMKFLLIRGMLGELALKNSKEAVFQKLSGYNF